jgi:hypothetical protein
MWTDPTHGVHEAGRSVYRRPPGVDESATLHCMSAVLESS